MAERENAAPSSIMSSMLMRGESAPSAAHLPGDLQHVQNLHPALKQRNGTHHSHVERAAVFVDSWRGSTQSSIGQRAQNSNGFNLNQSTLQTNKHSGSEHQQLQKRDPPLSNTHFGQSCNLISSSGGKVGAENYRKQSS